MKRSLLLFLTMTMFAVLTFGQSQRLVLLEHFTQASCGPCAGVNPGIEALLNANPDKFTAINYHTSWPGYDPMYNHNTVENGARTNYYSVNSVPYSSIDGNYYNGHPNNWNINTINNRYAETSPFELYMHHELSADENTFTVTMLIVASEDVEAGMKAHMVVIEEMISFSSAPGSNGEKDFRNVMKKMLPNHSGTSLPAFETGDYALLQYSWEHQNVYEIDELNAIGFIQNNDGKEVLQAANSSEVVFDPLYTTDVEAKEVSNISYFNCEGKIQPMVEIRNNGSDNLTSLDIHYSLNGGAVITYNWTGNLGFLETEKVLLEESTFTVELENTLNVTVESPNGVADEYAQNNLQDIMIDKAPLGESTMVLYMILDDNPEETTWEVTNYEGDVIHEGGPYTMAGQTVLEQLTFESTNCYTFTIYDDGGDGLSQGGSIAFGFGSEYLINETDFGDKAEAQFKIEFTGISDQLVLPHFSMYPNPATDQVQFSFDLVSKQEVQYSLMNALGDVVKSQAYGMEPAGKRNYTIGLDGLSEGIYYLRIQVGDAQKTEKIVITK